MPPVHMHLRPLMAAPSAANATLPPAASGRRPPRVPGSVAASPARPASPSPMSPRRSPVRTSRSFTSDNKKTRFAPSVDSGSGNEAAASSSSMGADIAAWQQRGSGYADGYPSLAAKLSHEHSGPMPSGRQGRSPQRATSDTGGSFLRLLGDDEGGETTEHAPASSSPLMTMMRSVRTRLDFSAPESSEPPAAATHGGGASPTAPRDDSAHGDIHVAAFDRSFWPAGTAFGSPRSRQQPLQHRDDSSPPQPPSLHGKQLRPSSPPRDPAVARLALPPPSPRKSGALSRAASAFGPPLEGPQGGSHAAAEAGSPSVSSAQFLGQPAAIDGASAGPALSPACDKSSSPTASSPAPRPPLPVAGSFAAYVTPFADYAAASAAAAHVICNSPRAAALTQEQLAAEVAEVVAAAAAGFEQVGLASYANFVPRLILPPFFVAPLSRPLKNDCPHTHRSRCTPPLPLHPPPRRSSPRATWRRLRRRRPATGSRPTASYSTERLPSVTLP